MHKPLDHVSPLAVSVMLEIGRESVYGEAAEDILAEAEADASRGGDGVTLAAAISGRDEIMPVTGIVGVGGFAFVADLSGALYLAEDARAAGGRPASGERFGLRRARHDAAALRYPRPRWPRWRSCWRAIDPRTVIALGDSLHDRRAVARIAPEDLASLRGMQQGRDWIWLTGNHDPRAAAGARRRPCCEIAGARRHRRCAMSPTPDEATPEIAGHLHPAGKVRLRGRAVRRRCFVSDGRRCVMPAFGAYAGGLNVLDDRVPPAVRRAFTAHMLGASRVYAISGAQLCR